MEESSFDLSASYFVNLIGFSLQYKNIILALCYEAYLWFPGPGLFIGQFRSKSAGEVTAFHTHLKRKTHKH